MAAILVLAGGLLLVAIPIGWLWLLAHLHEPDLAIYLLALLACPATMIAWAMALHALNRRYLRFSLERGERSEVLEAGLVIVLLVAALSLARLSPAG